MKGRDDVGGGGRGGASTAPGEISGGRFKHLDGSCPGKAGRTFHGTADTSMKSSIIVGSSINTIFGVRILTALALVAKMSLFF